MEEDARREGRRAKEEKNGRAEGRKAAAEKGREWAKGEGVRQGGGRKDTEVNKAVG